MRTPFLARGKFNSVAASHKSNVAKSTGDVYTYR